MALTFGESKGILGDFVDSRFLLIGDFMDVGFSHSIFLFASHLSLLPFFSSPGPLQPSKILTPSLLRSIVDSGLRISGRDKWHRVFMFLFGFRFIQSNHFFLL